MSFTDVERAERPIRNCIGGNDWWFDPAREALDRLAGIADQTGKRELVEKLRLEVSRQIGRAPGVPYASADPDAASRCLDKLVELANQVRSSQFISEA